MNVTGKKSTVKLSIQKLGYTGLQEDADGAAGGPPWGGEDQGGQGGPGAGKLTGALLLWIGQLASTLNTILLPD